MRLRPVPSSLPLLAFLALAAYAPAASGPGAQLRLSVSFADAPTLARTAEPGAPAVPFRDVALLLPPETRVAGAAFVARDEQAAPASPVAVASPAILDDGTPVVGSRLAGDGATYPAGPGELLGEWTWHGYRVAAVRLYPERAARGADGSWRGALRCGAVEVTLDLAPEAAALRRRRAVAGEDERVRAELAARVANPELLARYAPVSVEAAAAPAPVPAWAPDLFGGAAELVIVTGAALAPEFQRLADYRTSRGTATIVATVEDIAANHPGAGDLADAVRAFLADAYRDRGATSVLLGGDVSVVPARRVLNTLYPAEGGTEIPVDLYYAGLDGDWNADGDERPGEPYVNAYDPGDEADLAAELAVGRAPVASVAEAAVFIDKIIAYESGQGGAQAGRALFLSEVLFPTNWTQGGTVVEDGAQYSQAIIDSVLAGAPLAPAAARLYEAHTLWPGSAPETKSAVLDSLNSGRYGLVNHVGHGFFYNMSVGDATIDLKDAAALRNGPDFFVLNSLNCSSAAFDYNCILERMVTNPHGGAVAAVGSARAAFPSTASRYQRRFYQAVFRDGVREIGSALDRSRQDFLPWTYTNTPERWTHMTLTLLGDPRLAVWTDVPRPLTVAAPDSLPYGEQTVEVTVAADGQPLAGATVCLVKGDEDWARATTDPFGQALLLFTVKSGGAVTLTVTAPDRTPDVRTVPVARLGQPYLKVTGVQFRDDGTLGSAGNGDGVPDAGERLAIVASFTNTGSVPSAAPVTLYAWSELPYLSLLSMATTVPVLAPGATTTGSPAILVAAETAAADGAPLQIELVGADGPRTYRDTIVSEVRAPDVRPVLAGWSDYPGGDGDGLVEAGESVTLTWTLFNAGRGRASGLTAQVEAVSGLTVVDGTGAWPDIAGLATGTATDALAVRAGSPAGAARGTLVIRDARGHEWRLGFDVTAPARPTITSVTSPTGGECLLRWSANAEADLLGYHVFRSLSPYDGFVRVTPEPLTGGALFRDSGLAPMTRYYYQVAAVDSSRLISPLSYASGVSTLPAERAGWPVELPVETSSHCAVGDVDGDGGLDVVLAADCIYAWDAEGVEVRDGDGDSQSLGPLNNVKADWGPAGVTLANLTSRPGLEIVASNRTARQIWVYQGDGSVAPGWPRTLSNWNWAAPAVGDLDGDGDLEIVVNTIDGRLYVWHHDGTELRDGDGNPTTNGVFQVRTNEWYSWCSPALVDLDGDGRLEIILATRYTDAKADVVMALRNDGTNAPGFPYSLGAQGDVLCSPAVGDVDGDGQREIVVVSENDRLHVIRANGQAMAPFPIVFVSNNMAAGISTPSPALGDFDGDGAVEIVAVAVTDEHNAAIHVVRHDGTTLAGWPKSVPGNSESSPLVGDISGDGALDVLFGIGGGADNSPNALYAFRADGGVVPGFPVQLSGPVRPAPTLADLDGDGGVDLVYGGWDLAMHVWDLPAPWIESRFPWPTFKGNPLRTGVFPQAWTTPVPDEGEGAPPARATLAAAAPNPFNPRTRIAFAVPGAGSSRVRLSVYDLRGRRVARLVDGELPGGRHAVDWQGRDDEGRPVGSGVYLYRLEAGGEVLQNRMTLVK